MTSRIEKNKKQRFDIAKEEHIKTTKNITKKILKIVFITVLILSFIYVMARYIGTSGLIVNEYSLEYEKLPDNFYGLKIIQISDLNYNKNTINMRRVRKLVKKVNSIRPNIIIFTGDLIYGKTDNDTMGKLEEELSKLEADIGKYAVFGEDDDTSKIIVENAGFINLENSYDLIYNKSYTPILITGFDSENPNLDKAFNYFNDKGNQEELFTISIMHKPDIINEILNYHSVDLAMAGHSLNGLIKIPGIGGIFSYNGARKYIDSYYKIDNTNFYVSGGIGTREYPYRLFNHPSINLYRLK